MKPDFLRFKVIEPFQAFHETFQSRFIGFPYSNDNERKRTASGVSAPALLDAPRAGQLQKELRRVTRVH
jgi:hypothetical protein